MTLGAERKKVVILVVLVVVAIGGLYMNSTGNSTSASAPHTVAPLATTATASQAAPKAARVQISGQGNGGEFRPRVIGTRPDDRPDPASIDPELRLDLLAKVQAVEPIEAGRNLFQYGAVPPPPGPVPALPSNVQKIPIKPTAPPATAPVMAQAGPPAPPPPAPINLKYYGFVKVAKTDGRREAFLLDGDEIIVATENETVKQRYKIVRIDQKSIVIEDTQGKNTQTLQLQDVPS